MCERGEYGGLGRPGWPEEERFKEPSRNFSSSISMSFCVLLMLGLIYMWNGSSPEALAFFNPNWDTSVCFKGFCSAFDWGYSYYYYCSV